MILVSYKFSNITSEIKEHDYRGGRNSLIYNLKRKNVKTHTATTKFVILSVTEL